MDSIPRAIGGGKAGKLMAEWFWVDRWTGSSAFSLPMEARGVYREMLSQSWPRGARLPNDPQSIRRIIGATDREWKRAWPLVARYWRVDGDSLVNDTQIEVYAASMERSRRESERGRKAGFASALARAARENVGTQAPTQVEHGFNPPVASQKANAERLAP